VSPTGPYEDPATTTWADWTSSDPAVVTITSTSETWADWSSTSSDPAVVTSTSISETWADWSSTSSDPAVVTSTTETWADWSSTSSDPAVVTSTSSTETWADWAPAPTGGLGNSGNTWGMTYSPYTSEGGCKDASTVTADLAVIAGKGFSTVRVYSTDCDTLENVGTAAKKHGLKLILGVFISSTGISGAKEQVWDIIGWAQWELVELIVVGNEAVFNGFCSASDLAGFISESAAFFKKAGYTGPVTTTEPLAEWLKDGSTFCSVIDVVAANLYAFFNAEVTADKAGDFIQRQIKELESVCPGKDTYVMESGWPNAGKCNGVACPSPENQATAVKSIEEVTGSKVIFFSYEDEAWKEPGEFGVEQYWGCAGVF
jgi:exo-beta-1,3-glucanase (GH17 family)